MDIYYVCSASAADRLQHRGVLNLNDPLAGLRGGLQRLIFLYFALITPKESEETRQGDKRVCIFRGLETFLVMRSSK